MKYKIGQFVNVNSEDQAIRNKEAIIVVIDHGDPVVPYMVHIFNIDQYLSAITAKDILDDPDGCTIIDNLEQYNDFLWVGSNEISINRSKNLDLL